MSTLKIINASGILMGRMASYVAEELLKGEKIAIINAGECIISGDKRIVFDKYLHRRHRSSIVNPARHGPFFPRRPEGIIKRAVRGMLPHKKAKGRDAMKRLRIYIGVPAELEGKPVEELDIKDVNTLKIPKYIKLKELSTMLGANI
ncbi:MAG: 50S ribosomal protein L13 [Candidatus Hydrothermarchaeaceae archaeon]